MDEIVKLEKSRTSAHISASEKTSLGVEKSVTNRDHLSFYIDFDIYIKHLCRFLKGK